MGGSDLFSRMEYKPPTGGETYIYRHTLYFVFLTILSDLIFSICFATNSFNIIENIIVSIVKFIPRPPSVGIFNSLMQELTKICEIYIGYDNSPIYLSIFESFVK